MARGFVIKSLGAAAGHVPGLRRVPVLKLLAVAEVGLLARDHLLRLSPRERRRLLELVRKGRGRASALTPSERDELGGLVAKIEPRLLVGKAADRLSPVPLPRRMVRGAR
ncbi:MAG TPA: hypothetical protein VGH45_10795 [Solirubrobacteraceae bacterium]|jgi:hypothetical protein